MPWPSTYLLAGTTFSSLISIHKFIGSKKGVIWKILFDSGTWNDNWSAVFAYNIPNNQQKTANIDTRTINNDCTLQIRSPDKPSQQA